MYDFHVKVLDEEAGVESASAEELRAIFQLLDPREAGYITREEFGQYVKNRAPMSTFM